MKLIKLSLCNFKGVKDFTLNINGESADIYGDNATGKTTIADAQCWLLFGKDSKGTKSFLPKTKGADGEDIHNLQHSVEGTYELADGSIITLKRVFFENWSKKRGSNLEEFTGHLTEYFVDGVPCKEKDYNERLKTLAEPVKMMCLSLPEFFPEELPMAERRAALLELTGDVSDYTVIASDDNLKELNDFLRKPNTVNQYYSVSELAKITKSTLSEVNAQLKSIPDRIDEATRAIPEITASADKLEAEFNSLQCEKVKLEISLNASSSEVLAKLKTELAEEKTKLAQAESKHIEKIRLANKSVNEGIDSLKLSRREVQGGILDLDMLVSRKEKELANVKSERESLLKEFEKVKNLQWREETICSLCGQDLAEDKVESAKEQFNFKKSEQLNALNERGKSACSKDKILKIQSEIEELKNKRQSEETKLDEISRKIIDAESKLTSPPFSETNEFKQISAEIAKLSEKIENLAQEESSLKQDIKDKLSAVNAKISEINSEKSKIALKEVQEKRIKELKADEKRLGKEYEKAQKCVFLCEEFTRTKVSLLTDTINQMFTSVSFRLFITQINGGIKEDCEVLVPSENGLVPYSIANNAARINAGLDIIRVLSKHYDFSMPVFVDNAESITRLDGSDMQVIRLIVSEADKVLRVVTND